MRSEGKETLLFVKVAEAKDCVYLAYAIIIDVSAFHLNLHYVCSNILYSTEEYKKEKTLVGKIM